jgi:hypothetical protein
MRGNNMTESREWKELCDERIGRHLVRPLQAAIATTNNRSNAQPLRTGGGHVPEPNATLRCQRL